MNVEALELRAASVQIPGNLYIENETMKNLTAPFKK